MEIGVDVGRMGQAGKWNHSLCCTTGGLRRVCGFAGIDVLEKASKARQGRWVSARVVVRKFDLEHRSVVPTVEDCGRG